MGQILGTCLSLMVKQVLWKRLGKREEEGIGGQSDVSKGSRDLTDMHGTE